MKKIAFLCTVAIFAISGASAQIKPNVEKIKVNSRIKQAPSKTAPAPAPAPVNKTTGVVNADPLVYTLTSARVKFKTGNDNKEFPSNVSVNLWSKNSPNNTASAFVQWSVTNEMKVNSETEIGLERQTQHRTLAALTDFQAQGLKMVIRYRPNIVFDAWKIESVSVVLEFKDQHGNPHPTYGNKTIVFGNAYGFLNAEYEFMECVTDGNFAPLIAVIKKIN